jgi:hypothetical protein
VKEFLLLHKEEKGRTVTVTARMNKWIQFDALLYKGEFRKEDFGDAASARSTFSMTSDEHMTTEMFSKSLHLFSHHRVSGRPLFMLDRHRARLNFSVLI